MSAANDTVLKPALIFLGSGLGGLLRYWLGNAVQNWWGTPYPLGTLVINVTGCLVMGFLVTVWTGPSPIRDEVRAGILIGVLGGYTTFSSFGRDTLTLVQAGNWTQAAGYALFSMVLSLAAVFLGAAIASKS